MMPVHLDFIHQKKENADFSFGYCTVLVAEYRNCLLVGCYLPFPWPISLPPFAAKFSQVAEQILLRPPISCLARAFI